MQHRLTTNDAARALLLLFGAEDGAGGVGESTDRHSATRVTREVYEAGVNRVDRLLRRRAIAGRLLVETGWGAKPLKELTESLAVLDAALDVARNIRFDRGDPKIHVVIIGDGHSPRTGALVALTTKWTVTSVDPAFKHHGPHATIVRLTCLRGRVEDFPDLHGHIVIAPHSHASPEATRYVARGGGHVISMPCCVAWPKHSGTEVRVAGACIAPDRTIYIERIQDVFDLGVSRGGT